MKAHQPAITASQRQSRNANFRIGAAGNRQTEGLCRPIEIAPQYSALSVRSARLGINFHLLHEREINYQSIVAHRRSSAAVSAATNRHKQFMLTCEAHGRNDVSFICTKRNESRPAVNPSIPDSSSFVVTGVRG